MGGAGKQGYQHCHAAHVQHGRAAIENGYHEHYYSLPQAGSEWRRVEPPLLRALRELT